MLDPAPPSQEAGADPASVPAQIIRLKPPSLRDLALFALLSLVVPTVLGFVVGYVLAFMLVALGVHWPRLMLAGQLLASGGLAFAVTYLESGRGSLGGRVISIGLGSALGIAALSLMPDRGPGAYLAEMPPIGALAAMSAMLAGFVAAGTSLWYAIKQRHERPARPPMSILHRDRDQRR